MPETRDTKPEGSSKAVLLPALVEQDDIDAAGVRTRSSLIGISFFAMAFIVAGSVAAAAFS